MRQIVMSAMLLLALLAVPAFGQGPSIRVNVPFEFSLDDKTYPAGEYAFSALKENVVAIEKNGRNKIGLFLGSPLAGRIQSGAGAVSVLRKSLLPDPGVDSWARQWIPGDPVAQRKRNRTENVGEIYRAAG